MIQGSTRAAIFAALFLCGSAPLRAQDITLTSLDGLITLDGTLESYDGELFRVNTAYGLLTLDAQGVTCQGPGCPDLTNFVADIRIAGAQNIGAVLMPALVEGFAIGRGLAIRREVQSDAAFRYVLTEPATGLEVARLSFALANSDQGIADLQSGKADLALSLRRLAGLGQAPLVIGSDALVPLVARGNRLRGLSAADLAAVLSGQVANWQALGGPDAPIALHALDQGAGLQQVLETQVLVPSGQTLAPDAIRHASPEDLADAVAADPFAFGVGAASDVGNAVAVPLTGPCGIAQRADPLAIKSGDYPLSTPLYLYQSVRRMPPLIRAFLDWLTSPQAAFAIASAGFAPPQPEPVPLAAQGDRLTHAIRAAGPEISLADLQALAEVMTRAERQTPTFRFDSNGRTLDPASRSTLQSLARALEAGLYDGTTLLFVGFSDGRGDAGANLRLSRQRAEAVRDAVIGNAPLLDTDQVTLTATGYGEALPIACDDTAWGPRSNRRVELWLQPDP